MFLSNSRTTKNLSPSAGDRKGSHKPRALRLETLEARQLNAFIGPAAIPTSPIHENAVELNSAYFSSPSTQQFTISAQTLAAPASNALGNNVADFLKNNVGRRVGGGECAQMVSVALAKAGADFTHTYVGNNTNDYDWGTQVARLTNGSQLSGKKFQVGDIIQYQNAKFSSGGTSKLEHHTQVVASVDSSGRILKVYEQNIGGDRTVRLSNVPNLSKLTGGSVTVYRAEKIQNIVGKVEFIVINNTNSSKTVTQTIGNDKSNFSLTAANTASSETTRWNTFSGNPAKTLSIGNSSVSLIHGAVYELYTVSGQTKIRRI